MVSFTRKNQRITESLRLEKTSRIPRSRAASFPVFMLPFVSVWNSIVQLHTLKSFGADNWKYIHPTCAAQLLSCYSRKKKIPPLDTVPLWRTRQPYYLNKVSSFPSTHKPLSRITAASMCTSEVYFSPPPLFPYSSPQSAGFALIFPAFVPVHCFTLPSLFNVLLKQVLTTVFYCLLNILLFSSVKVPGITEFQQAAF